jgi:hypothetical protein
MSDETRIADLLNFMRDPKTFIASFKDVGPLTAAIVHEFANVSRPVTQALARCDYKLFNATHYERNLKPCRAMLQKAYGLTDAERDKLTKGFSKKTNLKGDHFYETLIQSGVSGRRISELLAMMENHERSAPSEEDERPVRR